MPTTLVVGRDKPHGQRVASDLGLSGRYTVVSPRSVNAIRGLEVDVVIAGYPLAEWTDDLRENVDIACMWAARRGR